jgi:DNA polymerase-4
MERQILHIDMNNFFASCEIAMNPALRGRPVAVCGSVAARHGIVLAKSMEAKSCGVVTAEPVWQAKSKCPDLLVLPPHYDEYVWYSRRAREIYSNYTDQVEPFGLDECWLDVTGSSGLFGAGAEIAEEIRLRIKRELGLTVSIGVSFNKVFAKLGSDMKKPDAVTIIRQDKFREIVWPLPVGELLFVGRASVKQLAKYGIHTIGDLAQSDSVFLRHIMGKHGEQVWRYANGLDNSPVMTEGTDIPAKSIGHGYTPPEDLLTEQDVWLLFLELAQKVGHKLKLHELSAQGVSIHVRDTNLHWQQWQCKLKIPTQSALTLAREAFALFKKSYVWRLNIRSLSVTAIDLIPQNTPWQLDLGTDINRLEKLERLDKCVDNLRGRFGHNCVRNACLIHKKSIRKTATLPGAVLRENSTPTC